MTFCFGDDRNCTLIKLAVSGEVHKHVLACSVFEHLHSWFKSGLAGVLNWCWAFSAGFGRRRWGLATQNLFEALAQLASSAFLDCHEISLFTLFCLAGDASSRSPVVELLVQFEIDKSFCLYYSGQRPDF